MKTALVSPKLNPEVNEEHEQESGLLITGTSKALSMCPKLDKWTVKFDVRILGVSGYHLSWLVFYPGCHS